MYNIKVKKMKKIKRNIRIIKISDKVFKKAIETIDYIYFVNDLEGDDNANTLMYDIDTCELLSNNYLANASLIEDIENNRAKKISPSFLYNYNEILKNK